MIIKNIDSTEYPLTLTIADGTDSFIEFITK